MSDQSFNALQIAQAQMALRQAMGLPPESFSPDQLVSMLGHELRQWRALGRPDKAFAAIIADATVVALSPTVLGAA